MHVNLLSREYTLYRVSTVPFSNFMYCYITYCLLMLICTYGSFFLRPQTHPTGRDNAPAFAMTLSVLTGSESLLCVCVHRFRIIHRRGMEKLGRPPCFPRHELWLLPREDAGLPGWLTCKFASSPEHFICLSPSPFHTCLHPL